MCIRDSVELVSELEADFEKQEETLETAVHQEDQDFFVRRFSLKEHQNLKQLCRKANILYTSCFRCGDLRHRADECKSFAPGSLLTWKACSACYQGCHLPDDFIKGEFKSCIELRSATRQANHKKIKENPDLKQKVYKHLIKRAPFKRTPRGRQTIVKTELIQTKRPQESETGSGTETGEGQSKE